MICMGLPGAVRRGQEERWSRRGGGWAGARAVARASFEIGFAGITSSRDYFRKF